MDVRMDGRVAVITGSSTGLGLAMAKEFAASGASVALLARKMDALTAAKAEVAKAAGKTNAKIEVYSCDVAKAQPIADTWKKVVADFGKVDIVVNNAGISHAKAFDTVTDEDWQGDLDLKLFAAIRLKGDLHGIIVLERDISRQGDGPANRNSLFAATGQKDATSNDDREH